MLVNITELTLQTKDAVMLFNGGNQTREFIPGFLFTQKRLNTLFAMGMNENPYAEAALIEVDLRLEQVRTLIESIIYKANLCLEEAKESGIDIKLIESKKPTILKISHATEYTAELIKLMTQVDMAFRYIRTAHSAGFLNTKLAKEQIWALRSKTRMVFDRIITYAAKIPAGVTRKDIESKTAIGQTMIEKLGIPNEAILNREITFQVKRISELGY